MTWIRWEVDAPRAEVIGFLADRLGVKVVHALGYYNALCCGFGVDRPDGRIDQVTDASLEHWAMWDGRRGAFAAAIREWCAQAEDPGLLRGWWRNEAVLRKQIRDRGKPDGRVASVPRKSPANPARDTNGILGGNDNDNGNVDELRTTVTGGGGPAVQAAVAANTGLRANPLLPGFNELLPHQAEQPVADWLADGVPLALITETIQRVCSSFKPGPGRLQPSSFAYFDRPVRGAHAKALGQAQLAAAGASAPRPSSTTLGRPIRKAT